jgi:hypothetical protein
MISFYAFSRFAVGEGISEAVAGTGADLSRQAHGS